ncbi:hypothetical protein RLOC_00012158 [Lonchura striata]|uniref:Uncharacterized protein n=1 Tax=Lonchura striata TaxID=40157 RepID=A0A218V4U5_9PASE|nr:hypothetical protein RLOC_00012158 [Lonchura striata domestica]
MKVSLVTRGLGTTFLTSLSRFPWDMLLALCIRATVFLSTTGVLEEPSPQDSLWQVIRIFSFWK